MFGLGTGAAHWRPPESTQPKSVVRKRHRGHLVQQYADPVHSVRLLVGQVQVHRETRTQGRSQANVAVSTRSLGHIASLSVRHLFILKPGRSVCLRPRVCKNTRRHSESNDYEAAKRKAHADQFRGPVARRCRLISFGAQETEKSACRAKKSLRGSSYHRSDHCAYTQDARDTDLRAQWALEETSLSI